ncbi:helix-turn-helix domain-containing protein [Chenggangzhangella methanolivorans]|uniref:Helix-turn-helix domain-containing protein n=1 Tax=Chenggangzhangella methanolivorans TaxID=1437009 RepID=A0A9E6R9R9_9HYPH|nr:helix-turn-helix domain-containing protein [Chenggangzhangella methanolivorans]QZO00791.1 helix-turn-helix domain-containing protein [Chenggangzhangella methanolivorans]
MGERPIEVTHQQLGDIFAVRRASVTTSLHLLEGERAVRCRRGSVEVRDLARLEAASCGCHVEPWRP